MHINITEVRIKLVRNAGDKLRAFASITIGNALVIRDIKIIDKGDQLFVAMPSRKVCDHCPACNGKNYIRARFCNTCGGSLRPNRSRNDERGRPYIYSDIAHPVHQHARDFFQREILGAYHREVEASQADGYVPAHFDDVDYEPTP